MSLADRLAQRQVPAAVRRDSHGASRRASRRADPFGDVKRSVHSALLEALGPKLYDAHLDQRELEQRVMQTMQSVLQRDETPMTAVGRRVDEASPMVDARLPDGSRVNAVVAPVALDGSLLTIRKFAVDPLTVDDLVGSGTLTAPVAELLRACVRGRLNVVIGGGTGSGKTTSLNVLSSFVPGDERIVTVEDAAELQLRQEHVLRM